MARVIQVVNVDSEGHHVRLADGSYAVVPHPLVPHIGEEMPGQPEPSVSFAGSIVATGPIESDDEPPATDPTEVDGGA